MNKRLIVAIFLAPLLGGLVFGPILIVAYFYMMLVTILGAGPVFLLLFKLKKLNWWLATVSGFCLACIVVYYSNYGFNGTLNQFDLGCVIAGTLSGYLFFWIGLFRNPKFDFVKTTFPVSSLIMVPILVGLSLVAVSLDGDLVRGRAITLQNEALSLKSSGRCTATATVTLSTGRAVNAVVRNCNLATYKNSQHSCFFIGRIFYLLDFKYEYRVNGQRSRRLCG